MPLIHIYCVQIHLSVDSFLAIHSHTTYRMGSEFRPEPIQVWIWNLGEGEKKGLIEAWDSIKQKQKDKDGLWFILHSRMIMQ